MLLAYPPRAGAIGEVESMVRAFRANADRFKRILDTEGIADSTPDGWGRRRSQDLRKNAVYQLACAGLERKFSGTDDVSIADDFLTMGSNLEQLLIEPVSDAASLFFQRLKSALQSDPSLSWDSMAPTLSQLDENSQKFVEVFKRTVKDLGIPEESLPMLTTDGFLANPDVFDLYSRLWSNASTFHSASSADGRAAQQHQADTGPSTAGTGPSTATAGAGLSALLRQEGGSGPSNAGAGSPAVGPLARHVMDITRHAP
ncbi:hypothetical protein CAUPRSCDRAFT_12830 [Caulochytrium protostelioides]|uniref:Uncharacterized protein n=1 Tax=Caulochytrium protostelioides TaxID=1555241 RepID=A0A4P9WTZ8_9FUNG|nr:hypothetical protein CAUPRSCDRAFT_12830 [Caulochytrium protostelioides]